MISNEDIREYHFAGTGSHPPMTVSAKSQEEALEKYRAQIGMAVVESGYEESTSSTSLENN